MDLNLAGYHLTYDQEFSAGTAFNASPSGSVEFKTQFDWGGRFNPSNNEAQYYSDPSFGLNPFRVINGQLSIKAVNTPSGFNAQGQPFVSGLITTQETFSQHGGYFEIRAALPRGAGLWPAFWMLPTNGQDYPEIDILEDPNLGGNKQYFVHSTGSSGGGGGFVNAPVPLYGGKFHRYGVEWNDQTTTFYFDGVAISEESTPPDMANVSMYLLANLAIGGSGSWPGPASPSEMPVHYRIDYIRAFSKDSSVPGVAQQPISSPDGIDTTPSYSPPVMPVVTTGTGPQTLTLLVSEDYYVGDAKFTVSVDGVRQGGTFTCIAPKGQGLQQSFVFNGNWSSGTHTVSVKFLNDAYGGQSYLDRNLYVNGATIDGQAVPNSSLSELSPGAQSFTFTAP